MSTQKQDLLLELFGEEIPARMQLKAAEDFKSLFAKKIADLGLACDHIQTFITPRRLCITVEGLETQQKDLSEERKGPRVDAPQQAIQGFLKSTGLRLEECEQRETGKGTFLFATTHKKGQATQDLIPQIVTDILATYTWPKSMRWMGSDKTWVRPLHSGICVFGDKPLTFDVAFNGGWTVSFGTTTYGHRFMANHPFQVDSIEAYKQKLQQHFVRLDHRERRTYIVEKATAIASSKNLTLVQDDKLLDEVTGLVEWPVLLLGAIEPPFMKLPPELLITVMKSHQKYFALRDGDGNLAPYFIVAANMEATDGGKAIVAGNERVLKARFSDAEFFYDLDQKTPLEEQGKKLDTLIFHVDLGSMGEKAQRLGDLSAHIASFMDVDPERAKRVGRLCKADLVTEMVQEFPELQGIMGRYYAQQEGGEIAQALQDHYGPRGEDSFAEKPYSMIAALADKIDTLVGFFGIGIKPTGSKDPYALRRAAIGIIRLVETHFPHTLRPLFQFAVTLYGDKLKKSQSDLLKDLDTFMIERLKVYWKDQGIRYDTLNAVLPKAQNDPLAVLKKRALTLENFMEGDDGENLLAAYKRAANIVRIEQEKDKKSYDQDIDPALLRHDQERRLCTVLGESEKTIQASMNGLNFEGAMRELSQLRPFVDAFFDQVTVNDNDPKVRVNRLNLLSQIQTTLEQVADFSQIERGN